MSEVFYGYILEDNGTHYGRTELNSSNCKDIVEFIFNGRVQNKKVLITDIWDLPVIVSQWPDSFIDKINVDKIDHKAFIETAIEVLSEKGKTLNDN